MIETLVALVLSSVVIILVSTTFLVQNQYYSSQRLHAGAHDNARAATDRIASEIRSVMGGGILVAGNRTLTLRSPIVVGVICSRQGLGDADVHTEAGQAQLDTDEVAGVAVRDSLTGTWTYSSATWGTIDGSDGSSPGLCADNGADTTAAASHFHRIRQMNNLFSPTPVVGDVVMLYRETTFKILDSELEPGRLGLFRRIYGGSFVEFATGMDASAQFQYRTGGSSYADTIAAASLDDIDAVRIVAEARRRAQSGGQQDVTFGWSVNVVLRNAP